MQNVKYARFLDHLSVNFLWYVLMHGWPSMSLTSFIFFLS